MYVKTSVSPRKPVAQEFKKGELVCLAAYPTTVCLVTTSQDGLAFGGVILSSRDNVYKVGDFGSGFNAASFRPFSGTVTLDSE